jgi:hypothetical protein
VRRQNPAHRVNNSTGHYSKQHAAQKPCSMSARYAASLRAESVRDATRCSTAPKSTFGGMHGRLAMRTNAPAWRSSLVAARSDILTVRKPIWKRQHAVPCFIEAVGSLYGVFTGATSAAIHLC